MRFVVLSFALVAVSLLPILRGQITYTYPSVVPPGANSAVIPTPKNDWIDRTLSAKKLAHTLPKVDLIFDGDSITDFWQGRSPLWKQRYVPLGAFDFGIAGDTTENVLWRLQNGQVDGLHPKLVLLMIGTNNLGHNSDEQIAAGVKAILDEYQKRLPETPILLQAIFPRGQAAADPVRARIKNINQLISAFADGTKIIYIDFGDKFLQPDGSISKDIMADFLHPTPAGYQIWADAIQPTIDKYLPPAAAH